MDRERLEGALRELGRAQPPERLLTDEVAPAFWERVVAERLDEAGGRVRRLRFTRHAWPIIYLAAGLAAALLLSVVVRTGPGRELGLQVSGAFAVENLWTPRAGDPAPRGTEFHVAAKTAKAAVARVLALTTRGGIRVVPGATGAPETLLPANTRLSVATYPVEVNETPDQPGTHVAHFVVLSTPAGIEADQFDDWLRSVRLDMASSGDSSPQRLVRSFERKFGGAGAAIPVPSA